MSLMLGVALVGVRVERGAAWTAGTPMKLFDGRYLPGGIDRAYDISPDDKRFLMVKQGGGSEETAAPAMIVVQNWFEELKRQSALGAGGMSQARRAGARLAESSKYCGDLRSSSAFVLLCAALLAPGEAIHQRDHHRKKRDAA